MRLNIKCSKPPTSYWDYPLVISNKMRLMRFFWGWWYGDVTTRHGGSPGWDGRELSDQKALAPHGIIQRNELLVKYENPSYFMKYPIVNHYYANRISHNIQSPMKYRIKSDNQNISKFDCWPHPTISQYIPWYPHIVSYIPPKKMLASKLNIRHQQKFHQWLYHSILLFIPSKSGQFPSYPNLIIDLPSCYTTYWWKIHYKWRF